MKKNKNPIGKRVRFSKRCLNWKRKNAWSCNIVGEKGIIREQSARSYMFMQLLGSGYPYVATITGYGVEDCLRVSVILGGKGLPRYTDYFYVDRRSVKYV